MKPIKKFSTQVNQPKSILESLDSKVLDELIKSMGFNDIHELKREKNLLSKLEALVKEIKPGENISEDDAEQIENDILKKAEPKSLETKAGEKVGDAKEENTEEVAEEEETEVETEEETDDETEEETDDENEEEETDDENESMKTPKASRRIMTFEDFIKEETINKNVSYRDDEDEEDYAVPVADSKEEDFEEEEEIEETSIVPNNKSIKSFNQFVSEAIADLGPALKDEVVDYEGSIVVPIAKGDGDKTASDIEDKLNDKGEPKIKDDKEGEELVTNDQEITKKPETSKNEPNVQGTVVVGESEVNEAEVKSNEDFKEYAFTVLQNAFGDEFDETKAQELVDGLTSKYSGDYGAMIGALQSSLGK